MPDDTDSTDETIVAPIEPGQPVVVDRRDGGVQFHARAMDVTPVPESVDNDDRSVDIVASSGAAVKRYDWMQGRDYNEVLSLQPGAVRLDRFNRGAPLLDSHDYWGGTGAILGAVVPDSARVVSGELRARVKFSRSQDGERAFQDMKDGVLRHVSVGYVTHKQEIDETTSPETRTATDWEPYEVSGVAIPADAKAGFRSFVPPNKERTMPDENGGTNRPANEAPAIDQRQIDTMVQEGVARGIAAEQTRRDGIVDIARKLRLPESFADSHLRTATPLDDFRVRAIEEAARISNEAPTNGVNTSEFTFRGDGPYVNRLGRQKDPEPGERAMRMIAAVAWGKKAGISPIEIARSHMKDELTFRALQASVGSSGGYLIPVELSTEIIDLLRPRTVVRKACPRSRQIDLPRGNLTMGRLNQGATISYVGEGQSSAATQEEFGDITFNAKKAKAIVPVSNDLIRFAQGSADAIVRDDLIRQLAVLEDAAFLRGAGTAFTPKGIRNLAAPSNVLAATGGNNFTVVTAQSDMTSLVNALEAAAVLMTSPYWFFSQRTKNYFYDARDSVGGFLYRAEMDRGMFRGIPFGWTQSIPQNLGVSGTATEVYLIDMDEFIIADVPGLVIDASQEAAYSPDGETLVSSFDKDETVIRVIAEHDCNMRHSQSAAVLTGVLWQ